MKEVKKSTLVRISESEYAQLENAMENQKRSFSFLVSTAVSEYLKKLATSKPKNENGKIK